MSTSWPVLLENEQIYLRPLRFRDQKVWNQVRAENREWLSPWEATIPAISTINASWIDTFDGSNGYPPKALNITEKGLDQTIVESPKAFLWSMFRVES